jgi:hypothetical protein
VSWIPDWFKTWEWWPYILPVLLSGIVNFFVAYQKLYRDFRSPFFNPWISFGFWFWGIIQIGLPALVFFFYGKISEKPTVDFPLYWTAILVGFFFTLFVNANADLGFINISIDKLYSSLNDWAEDMISSGQTGKLADFTTDLTRELEGKFTNLDEGLTWLKNYFQSDFVLKKNPNELSKLESEIDRAFQQSTPPDKATAAVSLILKVRPKDCPQACKRFGCSQKFLQKYFQGR